MGYGPFGDINLLIMRVRPSAQAQSPNISLLRISISWDSLQTTSCGVFYRHWFGHFTITKHLSDSSSYLWVYHCVLWKLNVLSHHLRASSHRALSQVIPLIKHSKLLHYIWVASYVSSATQQVALSSCAGSTGIPLLVITHPTHSYVGHRLASLFIHQLRRWMLISVKFSNTSHDTEMKWNFWNDTIVLMNGFSFWSNILLLWSLAWQLSWLMTVPCQQVK